MVSAAVAESSPSKRRSERGVQFPGASLPGTVAPNDSGSTFLLAEELGANGFDFYRPITAWAQLATGEKLKSKANTIRAR